MISRLLALALTGAAISGCQAVGSIGNSISRSMPVIGERCENWQCITPAGRERSQMIHEANRRAAENAQKAAQQQQYQQQYSQQGQYPYPQAQYPQGQSPQDPYSRYQQDADPRPVNTYPPGYPSRSSSPSDEDDGNSIWW